MCLLHHVCWEVVESLELKLAKMECVVRMQMIDLHEPNILHAIDFAFGDLKRGVVYFHVANLPNLTRFLSRSDDGIRFLTRKAHRLFNEDMLPRVEGRNRYFRFRISVAEQHGFDVRFEHLAIIRYVVRDMERLGSILSESR